jgi:VIT1/CCC1 family predicted Fe2+/Mn2+ transporter
LPWLFTGGNGRHRGLVVLGAIGAMVLGAIVGVFSGRSPVYSAAAPGDHRRVAAAVTYGIGSAVGVGV